MRALLLSAGLGTRLRPITDIIPKCLVPINGKPLLGYWLELLVHGGIKDILINLHYMPDVVRDYIQNSEYTSNVTTVFEEELLGTAGTMKKNRKYFGNGPIMLIHADNLSIFDIPAFIDSYENRPEGIEITMMIFTTDDPSTCGIVELDDKGIVHGFHEKVEDPPGNLANGAVYIVSQNVLKYIEAINKKVIDFSTDVLPFYVGKINTFHNNIYHRDIGSIEKLQSAQNEYPDKSIMDKGRRSK